MVGSAGQTKYEMNDGKAVLSKLSRVLLLDDKGGKPEGINFVMGRRPVAAFGNSTGGQQMLEKTRADGGAGLMMLVRNDDAKGEYAYGPANGLPDTEVGTFSDWPMGKEKKPG